MTCSWTDYLRAECCCVFLWQQICSSSSFPSAGTLWQWSGHLWLVSGGPDAPTIRPYILHMSKLSLREWPRVTQGVSGRARVATQGSWLQVIIPTPRPPAFHSLWFMTAAAYFPRGLEIKHAESTSYLPRISPLNPLTASKIPTAHYSFRAAFHKICSCEALSSSRGPWPEGIEKCCKNMFPF